MNTAAAATTTTATATATTATTTTARRVSTLAEAARLLALLVRHGLKTLAFVKARSVAELLVERTRALLPPEQAERLQCYRAGYSKEARRALPPLYRTC